MSVVKCKIVRTAGIKVVLSDWSLLVFSLYMSTDSAENLTEFTECLSELAAKEENNQIRQYSSSFSCGLNAYPGRRFVMELLDFCAEQK